MRNFFFKSGKEKWLVGKQIYFCFFFLYSYFFSGKYYFFISRTYMYNYETWGIELLRV